MRDRDRLNTTTTRRTNILIEADLTNFVAT